jgi:hypothetical protein
LVDNRRAPLSWGLSLGAMCALMAGMYPSIEGPPRRDDGEPPAGLKDAFGVEQLNIIQAYLHAEMCGAALAVLGTCSSRGGMYWRSWQPTRLSARPLIRFGKTEKHGTTLRERRRRRCCHPTAVSWPNA